MASNEQSPYLQGLLDTGQFLDRGEAAPRRIQSHHEIGAWRRVGEEGTR
jgi:hypothetical protein